MRCRIVVKWKMKFNGKVTVAGKGLKWNIDGKELEVGILGGGSWLIEN